MPETPAAPTLAENLLAMYRARRSVRSYDPRPVPRAILERCIEAARLAPSACNSQPWTFLVADREPLRPRLAAAAFGGIYKMNAFAAAAPVLVALVAERSRFAAVLGGQIRQVRYNLVDIGIAGEHFVLQAAAEGVGTCWLGWFDERKVRKVLGLPRLTHIPLMLSMGYPAQPQLTLSKRKPTDEIRRYVE